MKRALTREIEDSLRTLFAGERIAEDLRFILSEAAESVEFARLVLLAGCTRDPGQTALIMAAMLLTGMQIERRHDEIDLLERMYGGPAA